MTAVGLGLSVGSKAFFGVNNKELCRENYGDFIWVLCIIRYLKEDLLHTFALWICCIKV